MSIILPILFFATIMGLFAKRITPIHWGALTFWIVLVIAYHFIKPVPMPGH